MSIGSSSQPSSPRPPAMARPSSPGSTFGSDLSSPSPLPSFSLLSSVKPEGFSSRIRATFGDLKDRVPSTFSYFASVPQLLLVASELSVILPKLIDLMASTQSETDILQLNRTVALLNASANSSLAIGCSLGADFDEKSPLFLVGLLINSALALTLAAKGYSEISNVKNHCQSITRKLTLALQQICCASGVLGAALDTVPSCQGPGHLLQSSTTALQFLLSFVDQSVNGRMTQNGVNTAGKYKMAATALGVFGAFSPTAMDHLSSDVGSTLVGAGGVAASIGSGALEVIAEFKARRNIKSLLNTLSSDEKTAYSNERKLLQTHEVVWLECLSIGNYVSETLKASWKKRKPEDSQKQKEFQDRFIKCFCLTSEQDKSIYANLARLYYKFMIHPNADILEDLTDIEQGDSDSLDLGENSFQPDDTYMEYARRCSLAIEKFNRANELQRSQSMPAIGQFQTSSGCNSSSKARSQSVSSGGSSLPGSPEFREVLGLRPLFPAFQLAGHSLVSLRSPGSLGTHDMEAARAAAAKNRERGSTSPEASSFSDEVLSEASGGSIGGTSSTASSTSLTEPQTDEELARELATRALVLAVNSFNEVSTTGMSASGANSQGASSRYLGKSVEHASTRENPLVANLASLQVADIQGFDARFADQVHDTERSGSSDGVEPTAPTDEGDSEILHKCQEMLNELIKEVEQTQTNRSASIHKPVERLNQAFSSQI